MAENEFGLGRMLAVFVILIIGVSLIAIIAEQEQAKTTQTNAAAETLSLANARVQGSGLNQTYYYHLTYGCPGSNWRNDDPTCTTNNVVVKNASGFALTVTTDYVVTNTNSVCTGATAGDLRFVNASNLYNQVSNTTTVTYSYCPNEYIASSWGRTVLNNVPGFFAIALLGASLLYGLYWLNKQREE